MARPLAAYLLSGRRQCPFCGHADLVCGSVGIDQFNDGMLLYDFSEEEHLWGGDIDAFYATMRRKSIRDEVDYICCRECKAEWNDIPGFRYMMMTNYPEIGPTGMTVALSLSPDSPELERCWG